MFRRQYGILLQQFQMDPGQLEPQHRQVVRPAPALSDLGKSKKVDELLHSKNATPYAETLRKDFDVTLVKRIHTPIDAVSMCSTDNELVVGRVVAWDTMLMHFIVPIVPLQRYLHNRWEIDTIANHASMGPCGIMTLCASRTRLMGAGWLDRFMEPREGNVALNMRFMVCDRLHWDRTLWNHRTWTKSYAIGALARKATGSDVEASCPVNIHVDFDEQRSQYQEFKVALPSRSLEFEVEDTGIQMLEPQLNVTPGFADNESALRVLAMATESHSRGHAGSVYRQPAWSTPAIPTLGNLKKATGLEEFLKEELHGILPLGGCKPMATWLVREIPEIRFYKADAGVEEENEPNSVSLMGAQDVSDRASTKALNRQKLFRAELREKTYAEKEGRDIPR